jgi:hypothetical protein
VPPYPYHQLTAMVREHQRDLYRTDTVRAGWTRAKPALTGRRPFLVRLLNRVVGPR